MAIIQAFDLYRFYHAKEEETLALRGVSISVEAGEIVVVMEAELGDRIVFLQDGRVINVGNTC